MFLSHVKLDSFEKFYEKGNHSRSMHFNDRLFTTLFQWKANIFHFKISLWQNMNLQNLHFLDRFRKVLKL